MGKFTDPAKMLFLADVGLAKIEGSINGKTDEPSCLCGLNFFLLLPP
jgi:hypothetical protein